MVLQNLAWSKEFFWDGRANSLENQILVTILDSTEMDETWSNFLSEIEYDNNYRNMFFEAFGILNPDSIHAAKAIAKFAPHHRCQHRGRGKQICHVRGTTAGEAADVQIH